MINFSDTTFYDKESAHYSERRYEGPVNSYNQYFFRRRLSLVMKLIRRYFDGIKGQTLVEDGCADGVIIKKISETFPGMFSELIGTDISPKMIAAARENVQKKGYASSEPEDRGRVSAVFYIKNELPRDVRADCLLAVGFVSPGIFDEEFSFIEEHLKSGGICIMSLVSSNSLFARFKLKDKEIRGDYKSFSECERLLSDRFIIKESIPYGLFIPKLWSISVIAKVIQPILELMFRPLPFLYHEKLYILSLK